MRGAPDPTRPPPPTLCTPAIISTRIIIDDRPLQGPDVTRRVRSLDVSLKPDRERANITACRRKEGAGWPAERGREGGPEKGEGSRRPGGYYLSMEIDLERGRFFAIANPVARPSRRRWACSTHRRRSEFRWIFSYACLIGPPLPFPRNYSRFVRGFIFCSTRDRILSRRH